MEPEKKAHDAMGSFKAARNRTQDWHAPYKGGIDVPVTDQLRADLATGHLSFWVDVVPNGVGEDRWFSLRLNRREYRPKEPAVAPIAAGAAVVDDFDDSVPF